MIVCPLHWYHRPRHLAVVEAEMLIRGAPTLRGYLDEESGAFMLREGTHRIRAAHRLRVVPVLICVPWWRPRGRLEGARIAAASRGLWFDRVSLLFDRARPRAPDDGPAPP